MKVRKSGFWLGVVLATTMIGCGLVKSPTKDFTEMSGEDRDKYSGLYRITSGDSYYRTGTYLFIHNEIVKSVPNRGGAFHFLSETTLSNNPVFSPSGKFDDDTVTYRLYSSTTFIATRVSVDSLSDGALKRAARLGVLATRLQTVLRPSNLEVTLFSSVGSLSIEVSEEQLALAQALVDQSDVLMDYMKRKNVGTVALRGSGTSTEEAVYVRSDSTDATLEIYPKFKNGAFPSGAELIEKLRTDTIKRF